jgi:hypothetical protein
LTLTPRHTAESSYGATAHRQEIGVTLKSNPNLAGSEQQLRRTLMTDSPKVITAGELPEVITEYLKARKARDAAAIDYYEADAEVTDEGITYTGPAEIAVWLSTSASEYTYSTEMTAAIFFGENRYDVTQHLEGDFPGGKVDLQFRFTMRDGKISRLVIEE